MIAIYFNASKHWDIRAKAQFEPHLVGGCFVGVARGLTEDQAAAIKGREGFELVTEEEFEARLNALDEVTSETTGDPVSDSVSPEALAKLSYNDLMKLAKTRGIPIPQGAKKADVLALLLGASDPLGDAPAPPSSGE